MVNYMSNGKAIIILLALRLIRKVSLYKVRTIYHISEPYIYRKKIEFDLKNYTSKFDLKNKTYVNTSQIAKKTDLANLKPDIDKLD